MKILITENFLNHIPGGKEEIILEKMTQFVQEYVASGFNMSGMRHGVSVREIKNNRHGLRIFKFRISRGERVLFTFDMHRVRPEFRKSILFLDYCKHDDQSMRGKMIGITNQKIESYDEAEEVFDNYVDSIYENFEYDPNRVITRVVAVETMGQLLDNREDKIVYYLNDEQFACLESKDAPTFIFGSAGSGKTTINIYKAFLLTMQPIKVAYFTYSNYLVDDAKKLYKKIVTDSQEFRYEELSQRIQFHHFNQFISNEVNQYQVVRYEEFQKWVIAHHPILLKNIGVEVYDIWKEIRGIIKGMIPKEWIMYEIPMSEVKLPQESVDLLLRRDLAHIQKNKLVLHAEKLYEAKSEYLDPYTMQGVLLMHRLLDEYLVQHVMIELETYLRLDEQYCLYSEDQRRDLYEIARSYHEFLKNYDKVDENDLARLFIKKLMSDEVKLFDYVIADEIQDLTEIQIYCLIRLSRNRNHILFSGDINQTIRPTYFHTGRIESLLKTSNTHLAFEKYRLVKNYRSTKEVVEFANKVIDLRVESLGLNKKNDYKEHSIRARQSDVFFCEFKNSKDVLTLIETGINRHYVAIVVPDEHEKKELERLTKVKGAIFTVEEIKGIEKEYIICYNVMSKYKEIWETIILEDVIGQQKYRYYFNLLYVALTRARHQLCFVEEDMSSNLFEALESHFLVKTEYDEVDFKLAIVSTDNQFYKEAQVYERRELYEQAIHEYKLSNLEVAKTDILRCRALMKNQEGEHLEAGYELMKLKSYEKAAFCFLQAQDQLNYLKALVYQDIAFEKLQGIFEEKGIDLLDFVYKRQNSISWIKRFNKLYALSLNRRLHTIEKIVGNIKTINEECLE